MKGMVEIGTYEEQLKLIRGADNLEGPVLPLSLPAVDWGGLVSELEELVGYGWSAVWRSSLSERFVSGPTYSRDKILLQINREENL